LSEGRTLGIDYGRKRFGLAISDGLGITAQPLGVVENTGPKETMEEIAGIVAENGVDAVVVGLPLNMDGSVGPKAREVQEFCKALSEALGIAVETFDERLTTVEAERRLKETGATRRKRRRKVDVVAAQIILQTFIDSRRRGEES